jgi:hypothetical protein
MRDDIQPFLIADFDAGRLPRDTRVVHQNVDPAKLVHRLLGHTLYRRRIAHVKLESDGLTAHARHFLRCFLGILLQNVGHDNIRARARQHPRGFAPNAAPRARNQRHTSAQIKQVFHDVFLKK